MSRLLHTIESSSTAWDCSTSASKPVDTSLNPRLRTTLQTALLTLAKAVFYIARPCVCFEALTASSGTSWRSCSLIRFAIRDATMGCAVTDIRRRVNEIHNWDFGQYSKSFIFDAKGGLAHKPGGRDSISLHLEEITALGLESEEPSWK